MYCSNAETIGTTHACSMGASVFQGLPVEFLVGMTTHKCTGYDMDTFLKLDIWLAPKSLASD